MNNKQEKLLPCPWCGHIPKLTKGIKVRCVNVECTVQPRTINNWTKAFDDMAIKEWNTRV